MEQAILGVLALVVTVMIYLDRCRRDDTRELRRELREDMNAGFAELRDEIRAASARTGARIDQLTGTVTQLAESLGQVKGRTEVLVSNE